MPYPLGSFPRYGHQQRWASARRERAINNSIVTRQARAYEHLQTEIAFYNVLCGFADTMKANNAEGEMLISQFQERLRSIHRKLSVGKRVYYRKLTETLLFCCEITGSYPELKDMTQYQLEAIVENEAEKFIMKNERRGY